MSYVVNEYYMGRFERTHAEFVELEDAHDFVTELEDEPGVEYQILPVNGDG